MNDKRAADVSYDFQETGVGDAIVVETARGFAIATFRFGANDGGEKEGEGLRPIKKQWQQNTLPSLIFFSLVVNAKGQTTRILSRSRALRYA